MKEEQLLSEAVESLPKGFLLQYELNINDIHDGWGKLTGPRGEVATFMLEIKHIHRKESLMKVREQMARLPVDVPALLVCNRLTSALAEYCSDNQINFIDTAGNACIQVPGLYLIIEGRYEKKPVAVSSHFAEGVMKLLFVLLSYPESLNDTYRSLAEKSGISLGMVSKAFDYLEAKRYYRKSKKGRRLMNESELQVLWLQDYATALRPKLDFLSLSSPASWDEITLVADEYWCGEIAAAELSGGYLIPESGVIFTPHSLLQRRKELGLRPVPDGKLQLISCFWRNFTLNRKSEAMLCVAELLASGEDRNREAARIINDKYLHFSESDLFSY
ncbi:type IV toxin-antitoxin system AbiEi family antitoxin [Pectobacterium brasiliense]|uniref:type IV toxin-antitoxin system AbiEi family antitoxin n=1 Tax=Pectobacterium TaxID=122277 RepID=UPI00200C1FAD|nr:type IV toxin-antitoxin system AbiEi family antitoxin [Pectobacterium sp. 21LCBS03]UPY93609.1 type IV toxin-antitoxin system AbiEi family antitoxin [Pectobacterium sp. 21LCBS03]